MCSAVGMAADSKIKYRLPCLFKWNSFSLLPFSKTIKIEVPYKIHTIHHHHTEKVRLGDEDLKLIRLFGNFFVDL